MARKTNQVEAKLEDDELFKAIGGQLDENFDYSSWQRTEGSGPTRVSNTQRPTHKPSFMVETRPKESEKPHLSRQSKKENALEKADRKKKEDQLKILQLRIDNRRQTIENYERRQKELLKANMKVREDIENIEKNSHDSVKKMLRRYEKFRGGMSTLQDHFVGDIAGARKAYDSTRLQVAVDLAGLEKQVAKVDEVLKARQAELYTLVNYKDKEYPVKSLQIAELQKQIEDLRISNAEDEAEILQTLEKALLDDDLENVLLNDDEEEAELQHVVESEVEKYSKSAADVTNSMSQAVMEEALSRLHPSLKDMSTHNSVMAKEIEFHKQEQQQLEEQIRDLQAEVTTLMKSPKTNLRQQLFPEFFSDQAQKCTPDMDVVLDIPTQQWLPI